MINTYLYRQEPEKMKASIIDITLSGVVFRTMNNIEFFVPAFKIDDKLFQEIDKHFSENKEKEITQFVNFLNELNKNEFYVEVFDFDPVLDKKNIKVSSSFTQSNSFKPRR